MGLWCLVPEILAPVTMLIPNPKCRTPDLKIESGRKICPAGKPGREMLGFNVWDPTPGGTLFPLLRPWYWRTLGDYSKVIFVKRIWFSEPKESTILTCFLIFQQTDYKNGAFYVIGSDTLKTLGFPYNFVGLIFWIFTLFYCVSSLPVQFIYRYHIIVRDKALSKSQYFLLLLISFLGSAIVAIFTGFVLSPNENLHKEKSLLLENDIYYFREIPTFLVAEIQGWPLCLDFGLSYLLVGVSYGIVIYSSWRVWRTLKSHVLVFSPQTRRMHNQMTKTMILQVIFQVGFHFGVPEEEP